MKRTTSIGLIALACAAAFAITQVSAQESKPPASADRLDKFVGSGTCTGTFMGLGKTPPHATAGKYSGEKILDDNWVVIHYDEEQTATNPKPYHVVQYIGYDAARKRYVAVAVDNTGSGYSTGTSAGWKGDSITFDESTAGEHVAFRDTFTTSGSTMGGHTGTLRDKNGKWIKTDKETCHNAS